MFDRFIKLLYFLSWYFVGMATFSYATQLSDILENNNLLELCRLSEKILVKFNKDLNELDREIKKFGISFYLGRFLYHNDRNFMDCCQFFYFAKVFKDIPLSEMEEKKILDCFIIGFYLLKSRFKWSLDVSIATFGLTEEEHNFLASLDYDELIRKIQASRQDTSQQSSEPADVVQPKPTKTSCALL